MIVGVPKETLPGERRVALIPASVAPLAKVGYSVLVESGAGVEAGHTDADYEKQGATLAPSRADVFARADVVVQVRAFGANPDAGRADVQMMRPDQWVIGTADPLGNPAAAAEIASRRALLFALELVPRITRAQSMDVLSSMAMIAGYKAVLLSAVYLPKMFPLMMTAAGSLRAARVFVIGAGVAGLQAIATARKLGAVVEAYDVRAAVKEQIQSLGAKFVEMPLEAGEAQDQGGYAKQLGEDFYRKQRELMMSVVQRSDVVITTAAVPGKKSPVLVTREMVHAMTPGSVIVDLAAERGGNCEATLPDQTVFERGVTILGPTNLPATVPNHASQMFSKNVATLLLLMAKDGKLNLDLSDEILRETLVTRGGDVVLPRVREMLGMSTTPGS
jgi:NAD(P) transhydrogenase subunit alpha